MKNNGPRRGATETRIALYFNDVIAKYDTVLLVVASEFFHLFDSKVRLSPQVLNDGCIKRFRSDALVVARAPREWLW